MRISDMITQAILEMLEDQRGCAEIQRNELAGKLGCVPSQINYVITSRFTPEQGFLVESRRGGGGYIRITRYASSSQNIIMHLINSIGGSIDYGSIKAILHNLNYDGVVDDYSQTLVLAAVSDHALKNVEPEKRDPVRASILKQMLLCIH